MADVLVDLVPVDVIEALTDLDFLHALDVETEEFLEDIDTFDNWTSFPD